MNRLAFHTFICSSHPVRCVSVYVISVALLLPMVSTALAQSQSTQPPSMPVSNGQSKPADSDAVRLADMEQRLSDVTRMLTQTQETLEKSSAEIQQLRTQLEALRAQMAPTANGRETTTDMASSNAGQMASSSVSSGNDIETMRDEQAAMQAEIKQHDQIKVETVSKYPLRVTGLALFNAFFNAGVVDNVELPTLALTRNPGSSHGSAGATMRQTVLTLQGTGPKLGGARSTAAISADFFGGSSSNIYGYTSTAGVIRMRQAFVDLDWEKTTIEASFSGPLISPLSPTSYATVAQPALAGSGNLWTWSPQLRIEQRVPFSDQRWLSFEGGFIYPQSPGYTAIQLDSPVEASRRPGYEGRFSYHAGDATRATARPFALGVGAYSSSQFYNSNTHIHSWAVTGDWQIPVKWFELSGEIYRGRGLGGLGGSAYKDTLTGKDEVSGLPRTRGVDAIGGWSQLKLRLTPTFEANAMFGVDNAFSSNFEGLILSPSSNPLQLYARNNTVAGNLVFRPKTYLILSPEYRRILSWRYTGQANVANIFTIAAGYQF